MKLIPEIKALAEEMTVWRRHLHAHPELSMLEYKTADYIETLLNSFGLKAERLGNTGVVAAIKGKNDTQGRSVLLRADIDALPIHEETNLPYASKREGVMHACGHDGHTAMLLGAAKHMAKHNDFDGTVYLLFQPAEETAQGANAMLNAGLFDKFPADDIYGLHNVPNVPLGFFGTREGGMLSAADGFIVTFTGKGGHASSPKLINDVLYAAAKSAVTLKDGYKQFVQSGDKAVLSVSTMHTSSQATNVMSDAVVMSGTFRSFQSGTQVAIRNFLEKTVKATAKEVGATAHIDYTCSFPTLKNAQLQTSTAIAAARQVSGFLRVLPFAPRTTGSEDFAILMQKKPGNFIAMGTGSWRGALKLKPTYSLHHPKFDFNDKALPVGATYWVKVVHQALKRPKPTM